MKVEAGTKYDRLAGASHSMLKDGAHEVGGRHDPPQTTVRGKVRPVLDDESTIDDRRGRRDLDYTSEGANEARRAVAIEAQPATAGASKYL